MARELGRCLDDCLLKLQRSNQIKSNKSIRIASRSILHCLIKMSVIEDESLRGTLSQTTALTLILSWFVKFTIQHSYAKNLRFIYFSTVTLNIMFIFIAIGSSELARLEEKLWLILAEKKLNNKIWVWMLQNDSLYKTEMDISELEFVVKTWQKMTLSFTNHRDEFNIKPFGVSITIEEIISRNFSILSIMTICNDIFGRLNFDSWIVSNEYNLVNGV